MLASLQARMKQTAITDSDALTLERRRMYVLFAIALFKLLNFLGGNWDIQWHVAIGRDNLFIPPHLMVLVAFGGGIILAWFWICCETFIIRASPQSSQAVRLGMLQASPAFFGVLVGYAGALLSGIFDETWHQTFGIDSTLWSPPHLCILVSTTIVDYSLMIGMVYAARRLSKKFEWRSPLFWGLGLTGAYMFEAVNFQMSQAFIEGYRVNGTGLMGILFPILVGAMFPMPMLFMITLAKRFKVVLLVFAVAMFFQIIGIGVAAAGFAILQPVSEIGDFVRLNPDSSIAKAAEFISQIGFSGWVGIQQTWSLALSAVSMVLVSLLDRLPWAARHPLIAAPVFSASLVIVSFVWIMQTPMMQNYAITWSDVFLGAIVSASIGLVFGWIGLRLSALVLKESSPDVRR